MRLIDADKIVEVAEHAYGEWNKAMGAAEGRQINRCYKMQELCKAVKGVADACPTIDPESLRPTAEWIEAHPPGGDPMTKQNLVDEYAREHLCATCEWKNDNICTLPRCMKMEERSKNERKTAQPR